MNLKDLLVTVPVKGFAGNLDETVSGLSFDSRLTKPGEVFFAMAGTTQDGHRFIPELLSRGVRHFVTERSVSELEVRSGIVWIRVTDGRLALAQAAHLFFKKPSEAMRVVGVTGTNGKTTTTYLLEQVGRAIGKKVGVSGTVNTRYPQADGTLFVESSSLTTPDAFNFQMQLRNMADAGVDLMVSEVSSHALTMKRVDGVAFDFGIFTNLTRDHLDFHQDLEDYFNQKSRLFLDLLARPCQKSSKLIETPKAKAAINLDDGFGRKLFTQIKERNLYPVFGFSLKNPEADFFVKTSSVSVQGLEAEIVTPKGKLHLRSPLIGEYNLYNILGVVAASYALHFPLPEVVAALSSLDVIPGRLERVANGQNKHIFVDYAHTPDALENVLKALAAVKVKDSRLHCLFGCGGDRDPGKRSMMASIAARLSDFVWITSDNPRTEDADKIIYQIRSGLPENFSAFSVEIDRRKAIQQAISKMNPHDFLLIAGKGHEGYQIIGREKFPFSDVAEARKALGR